MFSGALNYMKGLVGSEDTAAADKNTLDANKPLQVEESGDKDGKGDIEPDQRKGLLKQLSSYMGKDITSLISLPVWIFEPVSFLQVMSEPLQYNALLTKASKQDSEFMCLAYLAAFNCALYSTAVRTRKPFNPILGETFEIVDKKGEFRFLAEQVSHHPPIGVSETTSEDYVLQLETELKSKFYGNSSEVEIEGTNHFDNKKSGHHYTWNHLVTCCHNIIIGSLWLDHYGDLVIENHETGSKCIMKFAKSGWLGGRYSVTGEIVDCEGDVRYKLTGKWNESLQLFQVMDNGSSSTTGTILWEANKEPITNKFLFPRWVEENVIDLNDEYRKVLPPTDSRLRPDRIALEVGNLDLAGKEKHNLEEKQREDKKQRVAENKEWETNQFKKVDDAKHGYRWSFVGDYWTERENRVASNNQ